MAEINKFNSLMNTTSKDWDDFCPKCGHSQFYHEKVETEIYFNNLKIKKRYRNDTSFLRHSETLRGQFYDILNYVNLIGKFGCIKTDDKIKDVIQEKLGGIYVRIEQKNTLLTH